MSVAKATQTSVLSAVRKVLATGATDVSQNAIVEITGGSKTTVQRIVEANLETIEAMKGEGLSLPHDVRLKLLPFAHEIWNDAQKAAREQVEIHRLRIYEMMEPLESKLRTLASENAELRDELAIAVIRSESSEDQIARLTQQLSEADVKLSEATSGLAQLKAASGAEQSLREMVREIVVANRTQVGNEVPARPIQPAVEENAADRDFGGYHQMHIEDLLSE